MLSCRFYSAGLCRSCNWLEQPITNQLNEKQAQLKQLLSPFYVGEYLPPVVSAEAGFRNKAKMVVMGAAHAPILGIMTAQGRPLSLCECPLYPQDMQLVLKALEQFISQAGITPYNVAKRRGELKYILLTRAWHSGEFMLRFVLRSEQSLFRIERALPILLAQHPQIKLVSVNIQPIHMARLEGDKEIYLTEQTRIQDEFNAIPLFIRPKSFFQTNPQVAAKLYRVASDWVTALVPQHIWDLFCGVGGFGLHCASQQIQLTGIEIEPEAIACAKLSAESLGLGNVKFTALDSTAFAQGNNESNMPDVIIVNPPRRGLGEALCCMLNDFSSQAILYSSCNPQTLVKDLAYLTKYQIDKVQLFDMFPYTQHAEVLVLLLLK